jgi:hypothetical protein
VTKRGSNFFVWTGNVFPNRSSIFVPEWPNGEFVSILASFCVLDKITCMCKDVVNKDFLFRALSEDFSL